MFQYRKKILIFLLLLLLIIPIYSEIYHLKKIPSKLKSLHRNQHRILSPEEDSYLEQVYGDSYDLNYYYATLYLGRKKMPQTFILDTGSPTTTSPCSKCTSCGKHLNKYYEFIDDSKIIKCSTQECNYLSSSCSNSQCSFSISYSEGSSLRGFFNFQDISFENLNNNPIISSQSFSLPIGCTTKETHLFVSQLADGIMGLNNSGRSFVSMLKRNNVITQDIFTICFGQSDGYFSIGEIDNKFHKSNIGYVPLIEGNNNYYIKLRDMKVGDGIISVSRFNGFIDSGTTISYFPNEIYDSIVNEFKSYCKKNGQHCGKFQTIDSLGYCGLFESKKQKQEALNNYWPNITFFLEGYDFVLTPNDYFFDYKDNNKIGACLGFEGERTSKITFGGTFMHGHDIIFDRENHRIGFVEADCNRGQLISDNQSDIILNKDSDTFLEDEINDITKFNKIILIGIIIVACILFVGIIILIVFIMRRKLNRRNYDVHVDDSKEDKNNNNNVLEIKNQITNNNNKI